METLIATATFGLEAVVSRELAALGYEARTLRPGWLAFEGDASAIARANLWLRASDRLLIEMGAFPANDFGALFDQTAAIEWERYLPPNASFPVRGRSVKSQLSSVPACQSIVKKAIVERLKKAHHTETLPEDGPTFTVEVALLNDQATLTLDTSGAGLHKRGYRDLAGVAPLKETLAAGLLLLSFWDRERPFLDPFCGTGTLPIEAALIGRNRAPGALRGFAAESWPTLPAKVWTEARDEARALEAPPFPAPLEGSDMDQKTLSLARRHAKKAGVDEDVRFETRAFRDIENEREYGCIVTNPPYGDRMGDRETVRTLYRSIPQVLRRFPTWSHYILTSQRELEVQVGQKADRRRKLYNGRIECTYFQFYGPRPGGAAAEPAFGGVDQKGARQVEIFANRLKKRARHLRKWPTKRGIDAFRIYDRDIKEVPLTIDRYGELLLVSPTSRAARTRTKAEQADWVDQIVKAASVTLDVPLEKIIVTGSDAPVRSAEVHENGMSFEVRLSGETESGLPLDGRVLRERLRASASGKHVLVLPSRSGTFSVAAALGGATSVVSYDPDAAAHAWAKRNFALNGVELSPHRFVMTLDGSARYELIVIDGLDGVDGPKSDKTIQLAQRLVAKDGTLFVLTRERHRVADAEDVTSSMLPEDFRSRRHFRCFRWQPKARHTRVVE